MAFESRGIQFVMGIAGSVTLKEVLYFVGVIATFMSLYTTWLIIYRLFLHPLAKFPGPRFSAISSVPSVIALLKGRLPMEVKKLHDQYGSVVRISPNELAFNSAQAWEDIYGHRSGHINMAKDPMHAGAVKAVRGVVSLQYEPSDASHARQRRALAYSFSMKALSEQEPIIQTYCDKLLDNLNRLAEDARIFNMCDWLNFTTFDITGDLAFGESFGCLDRGEFHFWVDLVFEAVKGGALTQATRRFATAGGLVQRSIMKCFGDVALPAGKHMQLTRQKVLRRLKKEKDEHRDFIWYILKQGERFDISEDEIIANSALFILAGSETTSNALSGLIARLIWNPETYAKLVHEIRSTCHTENEVRHEVLSKLPYLNACIEEGLRVHPPVAPGLLRNVPKGGDIIDGKWIPEGTTVSVGSWAASHNPANFKTPDAFIPERWIDERYSTDLKKAMRPFSLGPRACIGKSLAYMEIRCILARVLWSFDIVSADGAPLWDPDRELKHMRTFMVWAKPQLNVKLIAVKPR